MKQTTSCKIEGLKVAVRRTLRPRPVNPRHWLFVRRGDLVWNAVVLVAVFLPLAGLAIDVPRYFALRSRLQIAADAAAEAAARAVDVSHFRSSGEVRLLPTACSQAEWAFSATLENLTPRGYRASLDTCQVNEADDYVRMRASATLRPFYNTGPAMTVHVASASRYRMTHR